MSTAINRKTNWDNVLHLVSQKKGGVGKSVIAGWIAEYLKMGGRSPRCFDTDPSNQTFSRMQGLSVKSVNLIENGNIRPILFDAVMEEVISANGPVVMDTGASSFFHFWNYVIETDVFSVLAESERSVVVHVPIAPAPDLEDTLEGFNQICQMVPEKSVVVWLKQHNRLIKMNDGQSFFDLPVAKQNERKLLDVVVTKAEAATETTKISMNRMLSASMTFEEGSRNLPHFDRGRICLVGKEVFGELGRIGL